MPFVVVIVAVVLIVLALVVLRGRRKAVAEKPAAESVKSQSTTTEKGAAEKTDSESMATERAEAPRSMVDSETRSRWRAAVESETTQEVLSAMLDICSKGEVEDVALLVAAGTRLSDGAKRVPIQLPEGDVEFGGFRDHCLARLRGRLKLAPLQRPRSDLPRVFLSYARENQIDADQIASALASAGCRMYLDRWALAPGDELKPRLREAIAQTDHLVVLLSPDSIRSPWVAFELEQARTRETAEGRKLVIPVLVKHCVLPADLAARLYIDLTDPGERQVRVEEIRDIIHGRVPLSRRVSEYQQSPPKSPYVKAARSDGLRILERLSSQREFYTSDVRRGLLWQLYRDLVGSYRCTIKIGSISAGREERGVQFTIIDRWAERVTTLALSTEALNAGIWEASVDIFRGERVNPDRLKPARGRLIYRGACRPAVDRSPAPADARPTIERLRAALSEIWQHYTLEARQSFLYDLQRLLLDDDFRSVTVLVGGVHEDMTLAWSPMARPPKESEGPAVTLEIHDPFFSSLNCTYLFRSQLSHTWEADIDMMTAKQEVILGLA